MVKSQILLWQARQKSIVLKGMKSKEFLPSIPFYEIKKAICFSLPNLISCIKGDERNVVLTLSRMWYTLETEKVASKDIAAEWVISKLPKRFLFLLIRAKDSYLGNFFDEWLTVENEITACVQYMREKIEELCRENKKQ